MDKMEPLVTGLKTVERLAVLVLTATNVTDIGIA
jgi:hypothetical protein